MCGCEEGSRFLLLFELLQFALQLQDGLCLFSDLVLRSLFLAILHEFLLQHLQVVPNLPAVLLKALAGGLDSLGLDGRPHHYVLVEIDKQFYCHLHFICMER